TDGSIGAARGAGIGVGIYKDVTDAFVTLQKIQINEPDQASVNATKSAYQNWLNKLKSNYKS
ncbi:MAG: carbohydrate kinase, partial [Paludibacter sp.]|nr:carbohydrate kinase [Paludibacter sp.]